MNWLAADDAPVEEQGVEATGVSCHFSPLLSSFVTSLTNYVAQNVPDEEPPAYTSPPNPNYQTPAAALTKSVNDTSPIPPPDFSDKPKREVSTPQIIESSATSSKSPVASASEDLRAQLSEANSQISALKEKLADQGLRQRKIGTDAEKVPAPLAQQQPQSVEAGVPVQIVAGLCLLSFLIAYFFF